MPAMDLPNSILRADGAVVFNTLFKRTRTGKLEQWDIRVEGAAITSERTDEPGTIITTHGHVDGKKQERPRRRRQGQEHRQEERDDAVPAGRGRGRGEVGEAEEEGLRRGHQALAVAEQVDAEFVQGGVSPMLAAKFAEDGDEIQWPAFVQPKLDGHRCIAVIEDGKATLWTRSRKPVKSVPHIVAALEKAFPAPLALTLDGELYNHELRDNFQKLSGLLRRDEPSPETRIAQYHVYDLPCFALATDAGNQRGYAERHDLLTAIWEQVGDPDLVLVETPEVADEDAAMVAFEGFLAKGYEGAMLRNKTGAYRFARSQGDRSTDLQKLKKFDDAEFKVIDVEEGRGKMAGHAVFVCRRFFVPTAEQCKKFGYQPGQQTFIDFNAKMKGPMEQLREYFQNAPRYKGQMLTVKYQGFYKSGKPRFPVAWRLREDM
jgi:DNA ligase-1